MNSSFKKNQIPLSNDTIKGQSEAYAALQQSFNEQMAMKEREIAELRNKERKERE